MGRAERGGQASYIDAQVVYNSWQPQLFPNAPIGLGLGSAEQNFNILRQAGDFWTHTKRGEIEAFEVNIQAAEAYKALDGGREWEDCDLCGKPQDLAMYCVEDALSTVIVFMLCYNNIPAVREEYAKKAGRVQQLPPR